MNRLGVDKDLQLALTQGRAVDVSPLAHALGLSKVAVYKAVERGEIPATRVGRRIIITAPVARRLLGLEVEGRESR